MIPVIPEGQGARSVALTLREVAQRKEVGEDEPGRCDRPDNSIGVHRAQLSPGQRRMQDRRGTSENREPAGGRAPREVHDEEAHGETEQAIRAAHETFDEAAAARPGHQGASTVEEAGDSSGEDLGEGAHAAWKSETPCAHGKGAGGQGQTAPQSAGGN
jgi:hypothetical protein